MLKHGITEEQWLGFLDGNLAPAELTRIRTHVEACAECSELVRELLEWKHLLESEAERLKEACALPEEELDAILSSAMERIRGSAPQPARTRFGWTAAEGITVLRFLMEPICGPGTARAAIDLAVRRSAHDGSRLSGNNWRLFVGNLSDATSTICGLAAGRLVDRAGLCLAIEEG